MFKGKKAQNSEKTFILEGIPRRFNEGPFWGNGTVGSLLYVEGNTLNFVYDHVLLWETRDASKGQLKAVYQELLKQRQVYSQQWKACGNEGELAAPVFPVDAGPCSTRLPGLTLKIKLNKVITCFSVEMNLTQAVADIRLKCSDGTEATGRVYIHSCKNILEISFAGDAADGMLAEMAGWDYRIPSLEVLKKWGYPESLETFDDGYRHMLQYFGDNQAAVMTLYSETSAGQILFACSLNAGDAVKVVELEVCNSRMIQKHIAGRKISLEEHLCSWEEYWGKCGVHVPEEQLQQAFELEMYKLFCNARKESTPVTLQGIWNHDRALPAWLGDLHNDVNVQACYWAAFKTGHIELAYPYIKFYSDAIPHFRERARLLTGVDNALHVPTIMNLKGYGAGAEWCFWNTLLGPELYTAVDFCWYFEFARDMKLLRDMIYPYLTGAANLYKGIAFEGTDGFLHIPITQSPEIFVGEKMLLGEDSTFIVSGLRYVLINLVRYADMLCMTDEKREWEAFLVRLTPEHISDKGYQVMLDEELTISHRHFSHLFPIFPLGLVNRSNPESELLMRKSLDTVISFGFTGYIAFSFPYLAILASRCGRGNMAGLMLDIYCRCFRSRNSFTVNGDIFNTGILANQGEAAGESADVFTLEAGLIIPAAIAEMIVHRIHMTVFLLPAIPEDWKECSGNGLTLEGALSIDVKMVDYLLDELVIRPGTDETVTFICNRAKGTYKLFKGNEENEITYYNGMHLDLDLVKGIEVRIVIRRDLM